MKKIFFLLLIFNLKTFAQCPSTNCLYVSKVNETDSLYTYRVLGVKDWQTTTDSVANIVSGISTGTQSLTYTVHTGKVYITIEIDSAEKQ